LLSASGSLDFCQSGEKSSETNSIITLQIDGSQRYQQMDGFGVNANTASWNGKELEPALDLLIDSLNATIWRVIIEPEKGWEDVNDNDDPLLFNWTYYNALYETPKFQKAWNMIDYLNKHGIIEGVIIHFMGRVPVWMGREVVKPEAEDEFVEMLVSLLYYARNIRHLQFGLMSPINESDIKNEGPTVGAVQYARILRKIIDRMEEVGLGDVRIVAPDVASMKRAIKEYIPALMTDPVIMSKLAYFGLHSYSGYYADVNETIKKSAYSKYNYWMTEWNAWRDGLDNGQIGLYDYKFASDCINYLLQLLKNGASAGLVWEAYDSIYEHPPSTWSYWGILGYNQKTGAYIPRKHFYTIAQFSKYVLPGAWRISVSEPENGINVLAFYDDELRRISIVGENINSRDVTFQGTLTNLPKIGYFEMYYTSSSENLYRDNDVKVTGDSFTASIPANCIFTLTGKASASKSGSETRMKPEPSYWYAGDIHVHRSCGGDPIPYSALLRKMEENDLAIISVLADMGNAEVKDSKEDLPKVNGKDAPESEAGRIIHWDAEWHWDATYSNFEHQALGGHLVLLGLKEAHQIWDESPYKILTWAKKQNAISGFAHMQYLDDTIQSKLNCCIPIDYPVETALGTIDFLSEDVRGNDSAIHAYYKLLNCGFRPGFAAGTDYPCNNNEPFGTLLTYVQIKDKPLTYRKWIEGIAKGKTVVSRNAHNEFLEFVVNGKLIPGDEIRLKEKGIVQAEIKWSAVQELTGRVELVRNGKVVASKTGTVISGTPFILQTTQEFTKSGWLCARRMSEKGHQVHTAAVFVMVDDAPVRASAKDAQFFVKWIDNILEKIALGGVWNQYFTHDLNVVQDRYRKAKDIFLKIAEEAQEIEADALK
jgi:O-glycosyl hydrolase